MSSIYEALKRSQMNRHVSSGRDLREGDRPYRIYWIVIAAVILGSALTAAVLYGTGVIGRNQAAAPQAAPSVQADPGRVIDLMNKADRLQTKGQAQEAIEVYTRIISMTPSSAEAYLKLGSIYYESKIRTAPEMTLCISMVPPYSSLHANDVFKFFTSLERGQVGIAPRP